ncbi:MAG: transglutaminase family protein [Cyanobacteria bacterium P01_G01_bin.39]
MLYQISHQTTYSFSQPVILKPHLIRLRPRSDRFNKLHNFSLAVLPISAGSSDYLDLDGNNLIKLWFDQPTAKLSIQTTAQAETLCTNPFGYLLEPWATQMPWDYPHSLLQQLQPYLQPYGFVADSVALELAQEIANATQGNTLNFLFNLNQRIYQDCQYITRETGEPFAPGVTWRGKTGSCRDYAVLFMEVCRVMGIAARFVSGYQEGDAAQLERDLHAWVEVYLPGAGWRGYDPTLGLVVSDRHIPLAASAFPRYTAAVEGTVTPLELGAKITSDLQAQIVISAL